MYLKFTVVLFVWVVFFLIKALGNKGIITTQKLN